MTVLADHVRVARRFQRSIRIDTDLADPAALEGFICPESSAVALTTLARHVSEVGQGAFTWTGPYGAGKSSLAVALGAVLNGRGELRQAAEGGLGVATTEAIWRALPPRDKGWRVLPVVGRRAAPARVIGEAIENARLVRGVRSHEWGDLEVLDALSRISKRDPQATGGLVVLIDEMGKFLEGAAHDGTDIHFFQDLAELASRSNRRLIVIGILHQAFEEYAHRLSREMRNEWAKIQGRFVDIAVSVAPDEQVDLVGRAIETEHGPRAPGPLARCVANLTRRPDFAVSLEACWPLHPIVACLLGPISRRRFGQNQRSIFGFLNSTEPLGFQDFIRSAAADDLHTAEMLWGYLRFNLEPSIMASPDGHRWALAVEAVERLEASGGGELHLRLLKTIGLVDLFKERSGLAPSLELLRAALHREKTQAIEAALSDLAESSLIIYRKYTEAYSIFEGSDFDIEQAVEEAYESIGGLDYERLRVLADFQPVIAKRHYHETGTLRWYDTLVVPMGELVEAASAYEPRGGSAGAFLLALPTEGDSAERADRVARAASVSNERYDIVVGIPDRSTWVVATLARELLALEYVRHNTPELRGDRVARIEVDGRIAELQERIEADLARALSGARWRRRGRHVARLDHARMNSVASDLADERYHKAPRLHNELLNRTRPSSNAVAARNALLRRMALDEGEERLGIKGFPAEGGLFASLIAETGLYTRQSDGYTFVRPPVGNRAKLTPAWEAGEAFARANSDGAVSMEQVFEVWRKPPFGIKGGLLPVLGAAFVLSNRHVLAFYREGIFQSRITDLDMDILGRNPGDIQIRWMDIPNASRQLLSDLADVVREMDVDNELVDLEPIDVARGVVAIHDRLPTWTVRTRHLSSNARRVRQLLKHAKDPNKLLFDDLPQAFGSASSPDPDLDPKRVAARVREGLHELRDAYPAMLHRLRDTLLAELRVPNTSERSLAELRARAENIRDLAGGHRQKAFAVRIAEFRGAIADIEGLASLALNKPADLWTDHDVDEASVVLADMAREFVHKEAFAHVKGRLDKRHAMAVVVGMNGRRDIAHGEFDVTDGDRPLIDALSKRIEDALDESGEDGHNLILAALAEVSARRMGQQ